MPAASHPALAPDAESRLLDLVRATCRDLHPRARELRIAWDSALERELGLDSLARVELLQRIEHGFGVRLPEDTLGRAETPRDLWLALQAARPGELGFPGPAKNAAQPHAKAAPEEEPLEAATLLQVLDWQVARAPDRTHITYLSDTGSETISHAQLRRRAAAVAAGLQREGLRRGEAVAIMLPTCPEYFYVYFGILMAGGIPVPIYPPTRLSQIEEHVRRHAGILANAQAALLVTVPEAMAVARLLEAQVSELRRVTTVARLAEAGGTPAPIEVHGDDIAFLQYTSGSTGDPKGVILTHANLLANIRAMREATGANAGDVFVSWLPLYHDMGLIGAWLGSLYVGCPLVVMSPLAFLARPERWLWAIHQHRGTLSAAPNFAYELCLARIDDARLAGLDLSSWRMAFNGAEAVNPDTLERFRERFGTFGLRPEALAPVYGLAESAVGLLFPSPPEKNKQRGPLIDRIQRAAFSREGRALPAAPDDPNPLRFVACGRPLPGHAIRIVDNAGHALGERVEGRLEFRGPSATRGYYRNPLATARLFDGDWLDTGDRAYRAAGEVYVTGRVKDIIIRAGRNLYPHELEAAVGALPGVRRGCVAAFGSPDPNTGTERLVVLAETRETDPETRAALREAIVGASVDLLGEPPDEVVLAPPRTVLKTSSGKVRRSATRELYEAGLVGARARAVWRQLARLAWRGVWARGLRAARRTGATLYAAHAWTLFWIVAPAIWLLTAFTPRPAWAWTLGGVAARLFLRLVGAPLTVRGREHLPAGPHILVANHASYLDGILLVAALPGPYVFVAKRELREQFIPRVYLERLGAEFTERFDARQGSEDVQRLAEAVARGHSLAFFPEGTFRRAPGLMPFRLGAFAAAVRAGVPIVPVAIMGARAALPADGWLPRRGAIEIRLGAPIAPPRALQAATDTRDAFAATVELRDAVRAVILRECGEGDADADSGVGPVVTLTPDKEPPPDA